MSLEVAAHSYLFRQASPAEEPRKTRGKKSAHNNSKLPFLYNPLHDLESLWWVALFFIVAGKVIDDKSGSFMENARREDQANFAKKLFRTYTYRTRAFQDSDCFEKVLDSLHPALEEVGLALDMLRNFLLAAYVDAEKDVQNIQFDVAVGVHACFIEFFGSLAQSLHEKDITIDPLACEN
ncbi:hypothetical protein NM688_g5988 [Phlebia brevispora]|uniref:Uncharacterized protein n=1 Tax=Phlebia brevispora TaxID=194682 RepID=A0ACC1SLH0_9APHY|nr:hypothetical protein NM688_g5988 [Phlebia brevispora]